MSSGLHRSQPHISVTAIQNTSVRQSTDNTYNLCFSQQLWANDDRFIIFKWLSIELLKVRCFISALNAIVNSLSSIGQKNRLSRPQTHAIGGVLLFKQENHPFYIKLEKEQVFYHSENYTATLTFCFYLVECFSPPFLVFCLHQGCNISSQHTASSSALCVCVCVEGRVLRSVAAWGHCITASPTQVST